MNLGEQIVDQYQNETFTKTLKDFKVVKYYHETVLDEFPTLEWMFSYRHSYTVHISG